VGHHSDPLTSPGGRRPGRRGRAGAGGSGGPATGAAEPARTAHPGGAGHSVSYTDGAVRSVSAPTA